MIRYIIFISILMIILSFFIFIKLTFNEIEINIKKKYIKRQETIEYMIMYENNNIYKMSSCFWRLNHNPIDLWNNVIEGQKYRIEYYGFNQSILNYYYQ